LIEVLFKILLHHAPNTEQMKQELVVHIPPLVYSDTQAGSEPASMSVRKTSLKTAKYQEVKAIVREFLQTMKIYLLSVNRL